MSSSQDYNLEAQLRGLFDRSAPVLEGPQRTRMRARAADLSGAIRLRRRGGLIRWASLGATAVAGLATATVLLSDPHLPAPGATSGMPAERHGHGPVSRHADAPQQLADAALDDQAALTLAALGASEEDEEDALGADDRLATPYDIRADADIELWIGALNALLNSEG